MPFVVKEQSSNFEPAPEGLSQVVCVDVVDLGIVKTEFGDKHMVRLIWQLPSTAKSGERHTVSQRYTVSMHTKAKLRQHIEMWIGKKLTPEQLKGFDLEKMIGFNGQVQITHNVADEGKVYANVQAIVPLVAGTPKIAPLNYVRVQDRPKAGTAGAVATDDDVLPF